MFGIFKSFAKSKKLAEFQRKIVANSFKNKNTAEIVDSLFSSGPSKTDTFVDEYIDFCLEDSNIKEISKRYLVGKKELIEIYHALMRAGLSQYIKGHYASLSTLAYPEPLEYSIVMLKESDDLNKMGGELLRYWSNEIPSGSLFKKIADSKHFRKRL